MNYNEEKSYVRELAKKLCAYAATDENQRKKQLWADHNELKKNTEPLLWVCLEDDGAYTELVPESVYKCSDPDLLALEKQLIKYLYQAENLHDDYVFEPAVYFEMPGDYTGYIYGNTHQTTAWGVNIEKKSVGKGAYHLDNFLKTEKDYETLLNHEVDFIPDFGKWKRLEEKYQDAVGDILKIQFQTPRIALVQCLPMELVHLRGLTELMYDVYDEPELLNDVFKHMAESKARLLTRLEENHLLFDNRSNVYTGSGALGYTNAPLIPDKEVKLSNMWGFADAQEFSGVSPSMFEEFALEHEKIGLNKFGMGCFACCESLDYKYDAIFHHLTSLRRLSISPWTDVASAAEKIGNKAIFSWKPDPSRICNGFDETEIYHMLCETAELTKDCTVEIILKDLRTCGGTNAHFVKFIELAKRAFQKS